MSLVTACMVSGPVMSTCFSHKQFEIIGFGLSGTADDLFKGFGLPQRAFATARFRLSTFTAIYQQFGHQLTV
ncbi:hypothetical protein BJ166DRAFT_589309 [Pestalotiopsis sp. NC0098]|nr:hypothetical protein BJ166DRAFT_589309 [Pestalotiopsis sp. NC0098]